MQPDKVDNTKEKKAENSTKETRKKVNSSQEEKKWIKSLVNLFFQKDKFTV